MGSLTYTPRTVLATGFSHLGAAPAGMVPKLRKNAKQPKPPKESKMSTPKVQIPAKRAPKRAAPDENYATQYVPPAQVAPAPSAIDPGLSITNDPPPFMRLSTGYTKHHEIFSQMQFGQSLRVRSTEVKTIAQALRHWIEAQPLECYIRSTPSYEQDPGYGRVWLIAGKSPFTKRKKVA